MTIATTPDQPALLPAGLRAVVVSATVAAHLGLVAVLGLSAPPPQVLAPLNIEMIPQGDDFVDTAQVAGAAAEPPAQEKEAAQELLPPREAVADPAPQQAAAEPPAPTLLAPAPEAPEAELTEQEQQRQKAEAAEQARERQKLEKRRRQRQQKRLAEKRLAEAREARAGGGSQAHRAGVRNGQAARGALANYPMLVAAELNRHKAYPAAAKARGETGTVSAAFTVGPSGRIVSHSITRSSGSAALDSAVRAMMASAHAPPPPSGAFHGSIAIHFNLNR